MNGKGFVISIVAPMALASMALAQGTVSLYNPVRSLKDQKLVAKGWGSGIISETTELAYEGTNSLRISTRNFFQGGRLDFGDAFNLEPKFNDKSNLLKIVYRFADGTTPPTNPNPLGAGDGRKTGVGGGQPGGGPGGFPGGFPGGAGGFPGGAGGFPGGVRGGQGGPPGGAGGFPGGAGGFPGGGRGGAFGQQNQPVGGMENMRLVISTTDGKKSEVFVPVTHTPNADKGWSSVVVPLQAIAGLDKSNKQIKSIAISGDDTAVFYIGELRVVNESTPIRGDIQVSRTNLALGDTITFTGQGQGGSTILKFTWDFDDKDGVQADAEGRVISRRFRKAGTFIITMTVSDFYGLKEPYTKTVKITVNP